LNSFIAWIGGKKLLRKHITEKFPEEFERYIEVFGGAGWVLFGKEQGKELEVFNDIDSNLINLYRCIKYHCNELQRELEWLIVSREQFFNYKEQLNSKGLTDIQRAARYFYIIKSSFGADRKTFGTNKKNLVNTIDYLSEINERLKNVVIENMEYKRLIKVYDRPNALFYLDPPYLGTERYYNSGFNLDDHQQLCSILKEIKGKFILSYNDDEYLKEIYKDINIELISRYSNLVAKCKPGEYKEIIITNY
jgi:DNA adenine methylase